LNNFRYVFTKEDNTISKFIFHLLNYESTKAEKNPQSCCWIKKEKERGQVACRKPMQGGAANFGMAAVVTRDRVGTRETKLMNPLLVSFGFNILETV
jgi:hypothetical protein